MLKKFTLGTIAASVMLYVVIATVAFVSTRNRDLSIPDTVVAFEEATYGGDYETVWELSAPEYRAGRNREEFIAWFESNEPPPDRIYDWTVLTEQAEDIARTYTLLHLASTGNVSHLVMLKKIDGVWMITEYGPYDGEWPPTPPPLGSS